jgi:hypothetical protein
MVYKGCQDILYTSSLVLGVLAGRAYVAAIAMYADIGALVMRGFFDKLRMTEEGATNGRAEPFPTKEPRAIKARATKAEASSGGAAELSPWRKPWVNGRAPHPDPLPGGERGDHGAVGEDFCPTAQAVG